MFKLKVAVYVTDGIDSHLYAIVDPSNVSKFRSYAKAMIGVGAYPSSTYVVATYWNINWNTK